MSDMIVKVEFPTYDSLNNEFKSLIMFFMEHAKLCFVDTSFSTSQPDNTALSGCLIFYNYSVSSYLNKYLAIPFKNYFSEEIPEFPSLPVSNLSSYSSINTVLEDYFYLDYHGSSSTSPIFDTVQTQLLQCNTALSLYKINDSDDFDYSVKSEVSTINSVSIPVVLKPMINNEVNENSSLKPTDITNDVHDEDYSYRQFPMAVYSIDKQNKTFSYDFQYRTSSFSVKTRNDETIRNVFYKIGFCHTDPSLTELSLSDIFANQSFDVTVISNCAGTNLMFRFYNGDYDGPLFNGYMIFDARYPELYPKHNLSFVGDGGLPVAFITGIRCSDSDTHLIGLCYAKLYNNDGTPCNNEDLMKGQGFTLYVSNSESDSGNLASKVRLYITNQEMDGGFIPSSTF